MQHERPSLDRFSFGLHERNGKYDENIVVLFQSWHGLLAFISVWLFWGPFWFSTIYPKSTLWVFSSCSKSRNWATCTCFQSRSFFGKRPPTKRPQQRTIYTPSNKFLEVISEIQKAVANAGAMGSQLQYSNLTLAKLSQLLEDAVKSKSFDYGREVLGRILYLLSKSSKRKKRSLENEGNLFLRRLRQGLGNETFDSFMAVEGNVSLVFVIDDTGSMGDTIEAVKKIATAVINYPREVPVDYILSPFNDPMSGMQF